MEFLQLINHTFIFSSRKQAHQPDDAILSFHRDYLLASNPIGSCSIGHTVVWLLPMVWCRMVFEGGREQTRGQWAYFKTSQELMGFFHDGLLCIFNMVFCSSLLLLVL
jgi:hypothetical protein